MGGTLNVTATSLEVTGSIYTFHEEEKTSDEKTSRILDWSSSISHFHNAMAMWNCVKTK